MATTSARRRGIPPAYAWDWFFRQRLLWREARRRLVRSASVSAGRYGHVEDKADVAPLLRADYTEDEVVRDTVQRVIGEMVFLGRLDDDFDDLGARNAPRGMRWWWTELTGRAAGAPSTPAPVAPDREVVQPQMSLSEILAGFGDDRRGGN